MAMQDWANAIASIESAGSGGYSALGPVTQRGNRAYGKYQVMDFNVGPWTEKYVGRRMTPDEFLASPEAQEAVFQGEFGSYVQKYGNPQDAASAWFTGQPMSRGAGRKDILGTTGSGYVAKFNRALGQDVAADTMTALGRGGGPVTPDQIAQGAMAQSAGQEPEQPRGLLGNLFGNPDTMANLALAFNSMRLNPDPNLAAVLSAQMKERRGERKEKAELNKTVEMLRKIGADPRLIELAQAGYAKEAIAQAYKAPKEAKIIEVDGRLVRYDPTTGATTQVYGPEQGEGYLSKDQMTALNSLRDDLRTELKPFEIVKQGYNNISTFYNNPGSTSDYALAVAFAKILDPGSVAREGEVAAVQNAGARVPALGQALKNAITGEGALTPAVRQEIADLATKIYQERVGEAQSTIQGYSEIARRGNLPPELLYSGNIPQPRKVIPAAVPKVAAGQGVTQEMWDRATPEEKQAWMN